MSDSYTRQMFAAIEQEVKPLIAERDAALERVAKLEALLREGRGQSYGVMGIGTHKLIALQEWFAKVDAALGPTLETRGVK